MNIQKAFSLSVLVLSTVLLGCKQVDTEKQQGFLAVSLSDDIELVSTKAPTLDQYTITIKNTEGAVVHTGNYTQDPILLDVGNYTVALTAGSNPSVAFDTPYYYGTSGAVINPGNVTPCNIGVKLSNAIISPTYNSQLVSQFKSYHTEVTSGGQTLNIEPDETRTLYVKAGNPCVIRLIGINALDKAVTKEVANFMPEVGAKYTENFNILVPKFKIPEQNKGLAWTKEFTVDEVMAKDFSQGNYSGYASYISYEYSLNGVTSWIKIPQNDELKYKVSNLTSNTTYYVRARIDMPNNYSILSENVAQVKTENPRQVENPGMEDWKHEIVPKWYSMYYPSKTKEEQWWNTSNPRGFTYNAIRNQENTIAGVMYTQSGVHSGNKSAEIRSTYPKLGGRGPVAGKLLIGTLTTNSPNGELAGSQNPEYLTEGRPFEARPTKVSFWYKYTPYESDNCIFTVRMRSGETVISEAVVSNNTSIGSWTKVVMDLQYTIEDMAPTSLFVCFASSPNDRFNYRWISCNYPENPESGWKGYIGSILWIDDIELTYEK